MERRITMFRILLCGLITTVWLATIAFGADDSSSPKLRMAVIKAESKAAIKQLARMGIDIAAVTEGAMKKRADGSATPTYQVEAVISRLDEKKLKHYEWHESSLRLKSTRPTIGEPFSVYHSFDEPDNGIKAQLYQIQAQYRKIAHLKVIGRSVQHRPILAMQLGPKSYKRHKKPPKPQVLFLATHHAREWVATEMGMRLIRYLAENYGKMEPVTHLLNSVEIWVIPMANPDGYEYTFTTERLWRKNLRDNDGDGEISLADGVDLNRNFDAHWGLDEEGSSSNPYSGTYRGPEPGSEPETQAVTRFIRAKDFKFILSYHTYGNLILYPWGWQVKTPSLDDPIFIAQAGTDDHPAIVDSLLQEGYDPGVGADLYITNGDFTDWCYDKAGIPAYTVELTKGYGFEFPDDEEMVQQVFEDNLPFALALAQSAEDPAHPVSPVDIEVEEAYHTPLTVSYGSRQMVEILAPMAADLYLQYSINGLENQEAPFIEALGRFYNQNPGVYFSRYVAVIDGQSAGDQVTYSIIADDQPIGPFSYSVAQTSGNPVLLLSADDNYLDDYTTSLAAAGVGHDIWSAQVQKSAPDFAGVLSHYNAVVWYSGDAKAPVLTPEGENIFENKALVIRDFLNYNNGKLLATGQDLASLAVLDFGDEESSDSANDFLQYYLGSHLYTDGGGMAADTGLPYDIVGEPGDPIFDGLSFSLSGGDGADNQQSADTFLNTAYFEPAYDSHVAARYDRPGSPFSPHSGEYYVYSQMADSTYKRLGGTFDIPADSPTLSFWISYNIETDWDFAFVEIAPAGTDEWTTLPDQNGLTTTNTGDSCSAGWSEEIHPQLTYYLTATENSDPSNSGDQYICDPTGTTGQWHAMTGNSAGWHQVVMDLSAYAGQTVELYISYASDWGTQELGVFVDDISLGDLPLQDFETDLPPWEITTAADQTAYNNWVHMPSTNFPEGPVIRTADTVYFGFGLEAVDSIENRNLIIQRTLRYLGL